MTKTLTDLKNGLGKKPENESRSRIFPCLITACADFAESRGLPRIYGVATGLTLLSSVVGRRLFFETKRGVGFLNAFRFVLGVPGQGKSLILDAVTDILQAGKIEVPIAPASVTRASLVDEMAKESTFRIWGRGIKETVNVMTVVASEYGVFLGSGVDDVFYRTMADLFDGRRYSETRRSIKEPVIIENPYVNFLTGTQPNHFIDMFPRRAWQSGYATRWDFYYSEDVIDDTEFYMDVDELESETEKTERETFYRNVAHDLQYIMTELSDTAGKNVRMTPQGAKCFRNWLTTRRKETELTHPWLLDYNNRRAFRLRRDAILFAISRADNDYTTDEHDFEKCIEQHADCEAGLVLAIRKGATSGDSDIIADVFAWCVKEFVARGKSPIKHSLLKDYVIRKSDAMKADNLIRHLLEIGALEKVDYYKTSNGLEVKTALPCYKPLASYAPAM